MSKTISVSIGFPAYNESANIANIINDILQQNQSNFRIQSIIVVNDGSSDNTANIVTSIKNPLIQLINHQNRSGLAAAQNTLIESNKSEILVLINSDAKIIDKDFISKLIDPLIKGEADLTSAKITPLKSANIISQILNFSNDFKQSIYDKLNNGNNIYSCYGLAKAFNKNFLREFRFKKGVGEDAYCFLWSKMNNYAFCPIKNTTIYFKSPTSFHDHLLQSNRAFHSQTIYFEEFPKSMILESYKIPLFLLVSQTVKYFFKNPFFFSIYLAITSISFFKSKIVKKTGENWQMAKSSKVLISSK